ncbi:MAG TPA: hypothetical protein VGS21_07555 [Acidimicrobiales bacterium]|nr:hypothetical protein [Acidimicrobiales bacterium]
MQNFLRSRWGKSVAAATGAVALVGGLAFAIAGPMSGLDSASSTSGQASLLQSGGNQVATVVNGICSGTKSKGGGSAGTTAAASGSATKDRCGLRERLAKMLRRSPHLEFVVKDKAGQWITVDIDRGAVTSISSTSITIERPDGVSVTAKIDSSTHFRKTPEGQIHDGARAIIVQWSGSAHLILSKNATSTSSASGGRSI